MLDAIRRYQQHRIFQLILQNINMHLYLALTLALILLFLDGFKLALMTFFICVFLSLIFNGFLYKRRKDNYREAALHLDRELNGQDMFITILEYPNGTENIILKLLHDHGERISNGVLDQDFDNQDKKSLSQILRKFLIIFTGLLFISLFINADTFYERSKPLAKNDSTYSRDLRDENKRKHKQDSTKNINKMNSKKLRGDPKTKPPKISEDSPFRKSKFRTKELDQPAMADSKIEGKISTQKKVKSSKRSYQKQLKNNKGIKASVNLPSKATSSKFKENPKLRRNEKSLSSENKKLKSNVAKKTKPKFQKLDRKTKFDPRAFGSLGGQKSFQKIDFKSNNDIKNTIYKRQQDELEQVLNNPRMPKSYKNILKRFYSLEKK